MNARTYAIALHEALQTVAESEVDRVLARFVALIREHKREVLLPSIVKTFTFLSEKEALRHGITLTVAHKKDVEKFTRFVARDSTIQLHTHIDPTLIGGYVLTNNGTRTDMSYKRSLLHMYHNLIQP